MNDTALNVSEIIAEFVRRVEVAMDSLLVIQYKKGVNLSVNKWRDKQFNDVPLLRKSLIRIAESAMVKIPSIVRKAVYLNYKFSQDEQSYQEAYKMLKEVSFIRMPKPVIETTGALIAEVQKAIQILVDDKMNKFKRVTGMVYQKSIISTEPAKSLYELVMEKTTSIIDGKKVVSPLQGNLQTRTSIELGVRRSMQEVTVQAIEFSGPVFILCSSHGNSAPDHKDHQGKVYFYEGWEMNAPQSLHERIRAVISKKRMKSYQYIKSEPVKLWTRWNCTHKQMQVPLDEVELMSYESILNKYNMKTNGSYDRKKYKAQMRQRYMERQRRKYDEKATILQNAGLGTSNQFKELKIKYNQWGKRLTRHLSSNSLYLSRQRERERAKTLMFDFGVKLQFKE
jgi:hypothetical protein